MMVYIYSRIKILFEERLPRWANKESFWRDSCPIQRWFTNADFVCEWNVALLTVHSFC